MDNWSNSAAVRDLHDSGLSVIGNCITSNVCSVHPMLILSTVHLCCTSTLYMVTRACALYIHIFHIRVYGIGGCTGKSISVSVRVVHAMLVVRADGHGEEKLHRRVSVAISPTGRGGPEPNVRPVHGRCPVPGARSRVSGARPVPGGRPVPSARLVPGARCPVPVPGVRPASRR